MRRLVAPAFAMAACATRQAPEVPNFVVFFTDLSAQLDDSAKQTVIQAAHGAADRPDAGVTVVGYAAANPGASRALALARARVVTDALRDAGLDPGRIRAHGKDPVEYALDPVQARRVVASIGP